MSRLADAWDRARGKPLKDRRVLVDLLLDEEPDDLTVKVLGWQGELGPAAPKIGPLVVVGRDPYTAYPDLEVTVAVGGHSVRPGQDVLKAIEEVVAIVRGVADQRGWEIAAAVARVEQ